LPATALSRPVDHLDEKDAGSWSGRWQSGSTRTREAHVAVALDALGAQLDSRGIAATATGYRRLLSWEKELDGEIVVYGSRRLSRALIGMGLVDELRLLVYPVVLGAGDRLFGETQDKIPLHLVESRPFGGGLVNMIYAPATADG
jgi:dihydrofolate reductase